MKAGSILGFFLAALVTSRHTRKGYGELLFWVTSVAVAGCFYFTQHHVITYMILILGAPIPLFHLYQECRGWWFRTSQQVGTGPILFALCGGLILGAAIAVGIFIAQPSNLIVALVVGIILGGLYTWVMIPSSPSSNRRDQVLKRLRAEKPT
jgi:hypothetical protein